MISRIEAFRFRCFDELNLTVGEYHMLAGANGSGKSTLLDIPLLLGDMISRGVIEAFLQARPGTNRARAQTLQELVHLYQGLYFAFAIEAILPSSIVEHLVQEAQNTARPDPRRWPRTLRYELRLGIFNQTELHIEDEALYILPANATHSSAEPIVGAKRPSTWRPIFIRSKGNPIELRTEFGKRQQLFELNLLPKQLALANLPRDQKQFPVSVWLRDLLEEGMVSYVPSVDLLRRASPPGQPRDLRADAGNLPWLVLDLQRSNPDRFQAWVEHVQIALPNLSTIEAIEREEDHHAYLRIHYQNGYAVTSSGLSEGTLRILALTILPYLSSAPRLLCIEEPENGVHPRGIEAILQSLNSMYDTQVWVSTHSPVVLAHTPLESILVMQSHKDGSAVAVPGDQHPQLQNWQGGIDLGTLFAAGVLG